MKISACADREQPRPGVADVLRTICDAKRKRQSVDRECSVDYVEVEWSLALWRILTWCWRMCRRQKCGWRIIHSRQLILIIVLTIWLYRRVSTTNRSLMAYKMVTSKGWCVLIKRLAGRIDRYGCKSTAEIKIKMPTLALWYLCVYVCRPLVC